MLLWTPLSIQYSIANQFLRTQRYFVSEAHSGSADIKNAVFKWISIHLYLEESAELLQMQILNPDVSVESLTAREECLWNVLWREFYQGKVVKRMWGVQYIPLIFINYYYHYISMRMKAGHGTWGFNGDVVHGNGALFVKVFREAWIPLANRIVCRQSPYQGNVFFIPSNTVCGENNWKSMGGFSVRCSSGRLGL